MSQINYFQKLIHQELIGLINSTHPKLTKILHHHLGWDGNQGSNNNIFSFTENSNKIIYPFGNNRLTMMISNIIKYLIKWLISTIESI